MNIAERLREFVEKTPHQKAVVVSTGRDASGKARYVSLTFQELDRESDRLARGLVEMGVTPGTRLVLMVRPGLEFVALTFAVFKSGAVIVLIDPGMGRSNLFRCLQEVEPEGFIAIPVVHVIRKLKSRLFPRARFNVTVGRRWFWGGPTYETLRGDTWTPFEMPKTRPTDPAAILFTSGSTGPAKGVLYTHRMFFQQVELLRRMFQIEPGEMDLPTFPLFALFGVALGMTCVIPDMDPARPAQVNPQTLIQHIQEYAITTSFGSPALWNTVSRFCLEKNIQLPTLKRIMMAGAPVPGSLLERFDRILSPDAVIHTPYGATEALPVASISHREILDHTWEQTRQGKGTCVGKAVDGLTLKIIKITDDAIDMWNDSLAVPDGTIGEVVVQSPWVTQQYFNLEEATRRAKIRDGETFWHRMGDVGYLDEQNRLWFCGRKSHRVQTAEDVLFTIPCEAIFNTHPKVKRSALVGVGPKTNQTPVIIIEAEGNIDREAVTQELLKLGASHAITRPILKVLYHPAFPVDIRHNAKIGREQLARWAAL